METNKIYQGDCKEIMKTFQGFKTHNKVNAPDEPVINTLSNKGEPTWKI